MIRFLSISFFRNRIEALLKVKRGVYKNVSNEILSKKDGYRLVYLVSKISETVVFLDIYPKNGPSQQLDVSDKDLAMLLEKFADEEQNHTLIDYGID